MDRFDSLILTSIVFFIVLAIFGVVLFFWAASSISLPPIPEIVSPVAGFMYFAREYIVDSVNDFKKSILFRVVPD